ncbi:hypothetical protein SUGI_0885090 [Cryptomeria japonica]|nr:hypothetical protein SUGI_0885090 [Cryptomeria japonica]
MEQLCLKFISRCTLSKTKSKDGRSPTDLIFITNVLLLARWEEIHAQFKNGIITDHLKEADDSLHKSVEDIDNQEIYWKQRARTSWLLAGDKNSTFFHRTACARRQKNNLTALHADGQSFSSTSAMQKHSNDYFSKLFSASNDYDASFEQVVLSAIPSLISDEDNRALLSPIDLDEVKKIVFGMNTGKSPIPDGFPA